MILVHCRIYVSALEKKCEGITIEGSEIITKPVVAILKSNPWARAHLYSDHPEYSAILNVVRRYKGEARFVLVGTTGTTTERIQIDSDFITWDLQRGNGVGFFRYYIALLRLFLEYRPHLTIIGGLDITLPVLLFSFLSPRSKVVPLFIGEVHYYGNGFFGEFLHHTYFKLLSFVLRISRVKVLDLFVLSNYMKKTIEKMAPNLQGQMRLISYPISNVFCPSAKTDVDFSLPISLTIAGIEYRKGLDVLIKAVSLIPHELNLRVIIKGSGVRELGYMQKLNDLVEGLNLKDRIFFNTSTIDYRELKTYYQSAAFFVFPTREDCLGVALLEALHCGLPAIASSVGGVSDMVIDGQNGILVEPDNPVALADAMLLLIRDHSLRKKLGLNATKTLWDHYYKDRTTIEQAITQSVDQLLCSRKHYIGKPISS
jgi:glycosyltransferase involved in cell wall biosynthesis